MNYHIIMEQIGICACVLSAVGLFGWLVYLQSERNVSKARLDWAVKEIEKLRDEQYNIKRMVNSKI